MIDWEIVRIVFYISLLVGAPLCFFYFVKHAKGDDLNTAQNHFYREVEAETQNAHEALEKDKKALQDEINEKDAIIRARDAELAKMRPLLKYVRSAPSASIDAPPKDPDFGDDTL